MSDSKAILTPLTDEVIEGLTMLFVLAATVRRT